MAQQQLFVDVILPLALPKNYTYSVPESCAEQIMPGIRVVVQFGKNNRYSALVSSVHKTPPKDYATKDIEGVLDDMPVVTEEQLALWVWMSRYYLCTMGEVMAAALPGGLRLESESRIAIHPEWDGALDQLSEDEQIIVMRLANQGAMSFRALSGDLGDHPHRLVDGLLRKGILISEEQLKVGYKPKKHSFIKLAPQYSNEDDAAAIFDQLARAPKQLEVLMRYIEMSRIFSDKPVEISKTKLQKAAGTGSSVINQLKEKGIFIVYEVRKDRIPVTNGGGETLQLSDEQQQAFKQIKEQFIEHNTVLLHGVTSSGKTEVYVQLIREIISQGKQVLYLVPEIALTTQLVERLRHFFGDTVGVYHSRFNQNERVEIWNQCLQGSAGRYKVLLGARSAMFLPFRNLGLIVVDEEYEGSFKQHNPAPRYNARDVATVLANKFDARVLLGSATPSLESYWHAREGHYGLVELNKRYGGTPLPEVIIADLKEDTKKKKMESIFTKLLADEMRSTLDQKEQAILFQNRRGFSPFIQCSVCTWIPKCVQCDVSLTYHKKGNTLRCHYCGFRQHLPANCKACGSSSMEVRGFGTEKIEEELGILLPGARVKRMDLDTTRTKHGFERLLTEFGNGDIDILVGTQMVTKGLDFGKVRLVGVLNADLMLNFPDFRAFERSFQLMSQVSGRCGRRMTRGKVIIQTWQPDHDVLARVADHDYRGFYRLEVNERKAHAYPPFFRLVNISIRHRDPELCRAAAEELAKVLRLGLGNLVLGPEAPLVQRVRNIFHQDILVKIKRGGEKTSRQIIHRGVQHIAMHHIYKAVRCVIDVDPA